MPAATLTDVLKLVLALEGRTPAASLPTRLDGLFARLPAAEPAAAQDIEDMIWVLWSHHPDAAAEDALKAAFAAMTRGQNGAALALLDKLVGEQPAWAEAWNKRATLFFVLDRDAESVADIARTLELEPRHFGALCGFARICMRSNEPAAALAALEAAMRVHPHLPGVGEAVAELRRRERRTLN